MNGKYVVINGYGQLSSMCIGSKVVIPDEAFQHHFLSEEVFNNKQYYVGRLNKEAEDYLSNLQKEDRKLQKYDRSALMAIAAAKIAVENNNCSSDDLVGVNIGSSRGTTGLFEKFHHAYLNDEDKRTSIGTSPLTTIGNISSSVASALSVNGPVIDNSTTCSTAIQSVANAYAWLKSGMATRFIAGASEAPLTGFTMAQIEALGIYSDGGNYPCSPFSENENRKNSFVLGEAAGVFLLELLDRDELKSIKPMAVIDSIGYSFENPPTLTGISEEGRVLTKSMRMAIENMKTSQPIDMVLLHGTGTIKGDAAELRALENCFGDDMPYLYANKWQTGHTYAASATLNMSLAIECIQQNRLPKFPYPVIFNNKKREVKKVLINAHGFGGNAASIIMTCHSLI